MQISTKWLAPIPQNGQAHSLPTNVWPFCGVGALRVKSKLLQRFPEAASEIVWAKENLIGWGKKNPKKVRVWFNDSWFVFHDSSWSFHEPYFSRKYVFHES